MNTTCQSNCNREYRNILKISIYNASFLVFEQGLLTKVFKQKSEQMAKCPCGERCPDGCPCPEYSCPNYSTTAPMTTTTAGMTTKKLMWLPQMQTAVPTIPVARKRPRPTDTPDRAEPPHRAPPEPHPTGRPGPTRRAAGAQVNQYINTQQI